MKWLEKYSAYIYALLRIVAGFMFAFHGVQILFGVFTDMHPPVWSQTWIGGIIELVGGVAIMLGFQTRLAAFICSGTMAVAYVQYHWKFQLGRELVPDVNKGELSLLYSFLFLYFACRGGVKWCLDRLR